MKLPSFLTPFRIGLALGLVVFQFYFAGASLLSGLMNVGLLFGAFYLFDKLFAKAGVTTERGAVVSNTSEVRRRALRQELPDHPHSNVQCFDNQLSVLMQPTFAQADNTDAEIISYKVVILGPSGKNPYTVYGYRDIGKERGETFAKQAFQIYTDALVYAEQGNMEALKQLFSDDDPQEVL